MNLTLSTLSTFAQYFVDKHMSCTLYGVLVLTHKNFSVILNIAKLPYVCLIERMMHMPPRITVTRESDTGRNERFHDNFTGADMTRNQFVRQINQGNYENYHVRNINGVATPVSNPDRNRNNNLG